MRILADHSAAVHWRKVVSTIVQPNCSKVGILEMAEKMKVAPTITHKVEIRSLKKNCLVTGNFCKVKIEFLKILRGKCLIFESTEELN